MLLQIILTVIGTFLLLFYLIYKFLTSTNRDYWPKRNVYLLPVTKVASAWERLQFKYGMDELEIRQYRYFKSQSNSIKSKGFYGVMELRRPVLFVTDLNLVKQIMVKDFDNFVNRRDFGGTPKTDPMFMGMLFKAKGQEWKDLRATLSPTFTTGKIRRMYSNFSESSKKLANFIKEETRTSSEIEFVDAFTRYTLDVISSAAFGVEIDTFKDLNSKFYQMSKRVQTQFDGIYAIKFALGFLFPKVLDVLNIPFFDRIGAEFFANVLQSAIAHREKSGEKRNDFLQILLDSRNRKGNQSSKEDEEETAADEKELDSKLHGKTEKVHMTDQLILAQCFLFFLAGFDTTQSLLLFASYELALNPEYQEKLYKELKAAAEEKENGELDYDDIMKCRYLDKVVSETLRKYPAALRVERIATNPYQIPNSSVILDKETTVAVSILAIHRDEEIYPDPDKFDPERFSEENKAQRHPCAFIPFGVGPRSCIANRFALAEGKSAIAHLILNFQLSPGPKTKIPLKVNKTIMKPIESWLEIKSRS